MKKEIKEGTQVSTDLKYCGCSENGCIVDWKCWQPLLSEEMAPRGGGIVE